MKPKRTQQDWQNLFAEQRASGLSVAKFCQQHQIATTTFYNHRTTIERKTETTFCKVTPVKTELTDTQSLPTCRFEFALPVGKLTLPSNTTPEFLAQFIKGLSS